MKDLSAESSGSHPPPERRDSGDMGPAGVEDVLLAHQVELNKPGVLSVRPGYEVAHGWLTGRRAIVATVAKKIADPPADVALPESLSGVPVDVREASPVKRQSLQDPAGYAQARRFTPDHGAVPQFADEYTFAADGTAQRTAVVHPSSTLPKKAQLTYTPALVLQGSVPACRRPVRDLLC